MSGAPEKPGSLSDKKYWDSVHAGKNDKEAPVFVRAAKKILGPSSVDMMRTCISGLVLARYRALAVATVVFPTPPFPPKISKFNF